jgi:hypothetical protein
LGKVRVGEKRGDRGLYIGRLRSRKGREITELKRRKFLLAQLSPPALAAGG